MNSILKEVPITKQLLKRVATQLCPTYFTEQNISDRKKQNHQLAGAKTGAKLNNVANEVALGKLNNFFQQRSLETYVYEELNSYYTLAEYLHISPLRTKQYLENSLGIIFNHLTLQKMARGRKMLLNNSLSDHALYNQWLNDFLRENSISIPLILHRHPIVEALFLIEHNPSYLNWVITHVKPTSIKDFSHYLPNYSESQTFSLLQNSFPEKTVFIQDKNGKTRRIFSLDNHPIPPKRIVDRESHKSNLFSFYSSDEGQAQIDYALQNSTSKTDFYDKLGLTASDVSFLREKGLLQPAVFAYSSYEDNVNRILSDLGVPYQSHVTGLLTNKRREIDFYVPSLKLGIEVNPTYTHNSTYGWNYEEKNAVAKNYHLNKVKESREVGITTIMLYEKDLVEPAWSNITVPFLRFKILGADNVLYGRQVTINEVLSTSERKQAREFIATYHAQGNIKARYYYLIRDRKERLVGAASFSCNNVLARNDPDSIELKRLVFLPDTQVRFGLSKLVKHFFKEHPEYNTIYSYSRNDMGSGEAYQKTGFQFVRETGATLTYVNPVDPCDTYSWSVASPWSVKQGILFKHCSLEERKQYSPRQLVLYCLPRRTGSQQGYVEVYNSGNKLWKLDREEFIGS